MMKENLYVLKNKLINPFKKSLVLKRIDWMRSLNTFELKAADIRKQKEKLIVETDKLIQGMQILFKELQNTIPEALPHADMLSDQKLLSSLKEFREDVSSNTSYDDAEVVNLKDACDAVLDDLSRNRTELAIEKAVLFIQLFGSFTGNPLHTMSTYKLMNGAWRNGSIEGYPIILLLDALKRTGTISSKELEQIFLRTTIPHMRIADISYTLLKQNQLHAADHVFSFLLKHIFKDDGIKAAWGMAYRALFPLFAEKNEQNGKDNQNEPLNNQNRLKHLHVDVSASEIAAAEQRKMERKAGKIIVSGMGWSGSGAVYAYLKEFSEIQAVKTEIQHIIGIHGTRSIRKKASDLKIFREELLDFFAMGLFGYTACRSYQEYRTCIHANQFTLSEKGRQYADGAARFCRNLVSAYGENTLALDQYKEAVDDLLMTIAEASCNIDGDSVLLFDNIIKMHQLQELDYLQNARLIAVYRDPRSNYAALCRESVKFNPSVYNYIRFYRKRRKSAEKAFSHVEKKADVKFIQFEDFVTQEAVRKETAEWLGLDLSKQDEYAVFKPWVSEKNVLNYTDFEDKRAIRAIEKELGEYLWQS